MLLQFASQLLPFLGPIALDYVTKEAEGFLLKLQSGGKLTEEEKDDFYAVVDRAARMEGR
jgi:hypothetical protein